jgi:hypothetical protein
MRGECRRDVDIMRSTEAGRGRGVFDARATIQRHVRWVACTDSSYAEGGCHGEMRGECRRDVDITRSTGAGRDRVVSDALAMVQGHMRWVACTESRCGAGARDGYMRRECRCDVAGTGSTAAGRDRVVSDVVAKFQMHLHWVACTESSCGACGRDGWVCGGRRHAVDITRSTGAGRDRVVSDARAMC